MISYRLGTGIVKQLPFTIQHHAVPIKPKQVDDSIISSKFLKIFAVIAIIKVAILLLWI